MTFATKFASLWRTLRNIGSGSTPSPLVISGGSFHSDGDFVLGNKIYHSEPPKKITSPFQLPAPAPDFVGRTNEIDFGVSALCSGKPLGIFGMGGIGKTELARVIAKRCEDVYPDAQIYIDLRGTSKIPLPPEVALTRILSSLLGKLKRNEQALPLEELRELYLSTLHRKRAVLVLDNAHSNAQLKALLPPSGSTLIVTSRTTLSPPGIATILLSQMPPDEASLFFGQMVPDAAEAISAAICLQCGYLPLAIRSVASRLVCQPDLSADEYARRLTDRRQRLQSLNNPDLDLSVEASIGLSYEMLTREELGVFSQLVVFKGWWSAEAEEAICNDDGHTILSKLVQLSLVLYNKTHDKYALHDVVSVFVEDRKPVGPASMLYLVHAQYYANILYEGAPFGVGGSQGYDPNNPAFVKCKLDWQNIEAAQAWASQNFHDNPFAKVLCISFGLNQDPFLFEGLMRPREHVRWAEVAAAAALNAREIDVYCNFMVGLSAAYQVHQQHDSALDAVARALKEARKAHLEIWEGRALLAHARILYIRSLEQRRRSTDGMISAIEAGKIFKRLGDAQLQEAMSLYEDLSKVPPEWLRS